MLMVFRSKKNGMLRMFVGFYTELTPHLVPYCRKHKSLHLQQYLSWPNLQIKMLIRYALLENIRPRVLTMTFIALTLTSTTKIKTTANQVNQAYTHIS